MVPVRTRHSAATQRAAAVKDSVCGNAHLDGVILRFLSVQELGRIAQTNKALSLRSSDSAIWSAQYDRRWQTRIGVPEDGRPTREDYRQRAVSLTAPKAQIILPEEEAFSLYLTVVNASGRVMVEGQSRLELRDVQTALPKIEFELSSAQFPALQQRDCDEWTDRLRELSASLTLLRHSDRALASIWSDQTICHTIDLPRELEEGTRDQDTFKAAFDFGAPDWNTDNIEEVSYISRSTSHVLDREDEDGFSPSLFIPVWIQVCSTSGAVMKADAAPHILYQNPDTCDNLPIRSQHMMMDVLTNASFHWVKRLESASA